MKRVFRSLIVASLCFIGVTSSNAQNRYTFGDGKTNVCVIETNADVNIYEVDKNCTMTTFNVEPKKNIKAGATTHTLSVYPPEGVLPGCTISVASGEDYYYQYVSITGDGFIEEVEEGLYDVAIMGRILVNGIPFIFFILYDQVEVNNDVTIQSSLDDCPYTINVYSHAADGTPLSELNYTLCTYNIIIYWLGRNTPLAEIKASFATYLEYLPNFLFSTFDERSSIALTEIQFTDKQTCYFVDHDPITGCSGNIVFESTGDDLKTHEEYYHINTDGTSHYYVDDMRLTNMGNSVILTSNMNDNVTFEGSLPLTIVSNVKIENPSDFSRGYYRIMVPKVFETVDLNQFGWPQYENYLTNGFMYYNSDNQLVREPFHHYKYRIPSFYHNESSNILIPTPMACFGDLDEPLFFGDRTPLIYQQTQAYNAETSPTGEGSLIVNTTMMGENGIQRIGDHDALIHISLDGDEIYCDSIYKYNAEYNHPVVQSGIVTVDITDNHLVVEGIEKTNVTHTELDLSRDDAMPPTMTILQVKNQYGTESVELIDWAEAHIIFAAGDFELHYNEALGWFDKMQYKAKPNVEVYYSIEGGEWLPLEYTENVELFHVNYGNVFTIGLDKMEANVADKWVSLKFILTDEAGNSQTQELSNLFYAGEMVSVEENTVNRLQHEVFPNPFNGEVRITSSEAINGDANFNVYNVLGAQIHHQTINCANTTEFVWDGSQVPSGIYFYSISTEDGLLQGKIIKE